MARAARHLLGRHDFSAFRAADCQAAHAVREVRRLEVEGTSGDAVSFVVEGTAFLKHMVRNLVGTLVEVGKGRRPRGLGGRGAGLAEPDAGGPHGAAPGAGAGGGLLWGGAASSHGGGRGGRVR